MRTRLSFIPVRVIVALALLSTGAVATSSAAEFVAPRALDVGCGIYSASTGTICLSERPGYAQKVTLYANGEVVLCTAHPTVLRGNDCRGNPGEHARRLGYGQQSKGGGFRCVVLHTGVRCTVAKTGRGFLMTRPKVIPVGGASIRLAPLRLANFLSPDRRVWCGLGEGRHPFCVAGQTSQGLGFPSASAELEAGGKVRLCFVAQGSEAPLFHGFPEGCAQNWDANAPILGYRQQSELEGVLCTSATNGITCIKVSGAGNGKGFRINASEAVEVG